MPITISFENGVPSISSSFEKTLNLSTFEKDAVDIFMSLLCDSVDCSKIRLERRSESYVSMFYGDHNDFLRFKMSEKTKWISIRLCPEDCSSNIDNPLFSAQKNKKQLHWKSQILSLSDLPIYKSFLINACLKNLL